MDFEELAATLNSDDEGVLVKGLRRFAKQICSEHASLLASWLADEEDLLGRDGDSDEELEKAEQSNGAIVGLLKEYVESSPKLHEFFVLWDLEQRKGSNALATAHTEALASIVECLVAAATAAAANTPNKPQNSPPLTVLQPLCHQILRERLEALSQQISPGGKRLSRATLRLLAALSASGPAIAKELFNRFDFSTRDFARVTVLEDAHASKKRKWKGSSGGAAAGVAEVEEISAVVNDLMHLEQSEGADGAEDEALSANEAPEASSDAKSAQNVEVLLNGKEQDTTQEDQGDNGDDAVAAGEGSVRLQLVRFLLALLRYGDARTQSCLLAAGFLRGDAATKASAGGGSILGLCFAVPLWQDAKVARRVVAALPQDVVENRRVARWTKEAFFTIGLMYQLCKLCSSSSDTGDDELYFATLRLLAALLTNRSLSPFLHSTATTTPPPFTSDDGYEQAAAGGQSGSVVSATGSANRTLCRALALLDARGDANQREIVFAALRACPAAVAPYLASFPTHVVNPQAGSESCIASYLLISRVLAAAPLVLPPMFAALTAELQPGAEQEKGGEETALARAPAADWNACADALMKLVLPPALSKAMFAKGLLPTDLELQAAVMRVTILSLKRFGALMQLVNASAAAMLPGWRDCVSKALRRHFPEVQPLLSLRTRLDPTLTGSLDPRSDELAITDAAADSEGHQGREKHAKLYCGLLQVLRLYQRWLPDAVEASGYDLLKLLPPPAACVAMPQGLQRALLALLLEAQKDTAATAAGHDASVPGNVALLTVGKTGRSSWLQAQSGGAASREGAPGSTPLGTVLAIASSTVSDSKDGNGVRALARELAAAALRTTGLFNGACASGEVEIWISAATETTNPALATAGAAALELVLSLVTRDMHAVCIKAIESIESAWPAFLSAATSHAVAADWEGGAAEISPALAAAVFALQGDEPYAACISGAAAQAHSASTSFPATNDAAEAFFARVVFASLHRVKDPMALAALIYGGDNHSEGVRRKTWSDAALSLRVYVARTFALGGAAAAAAAEEEARVKLANVNPLAAKSIAALAAWTDSPEEQRASRALTRQRKGAVPATIGSLSDFLWRNAALNIFTLPCVAAAVSGVADAKRGGRNARKEGDAALQKVLSSLPPVLLLAQVMTPVLVQVGGKAGGSQLRYPIKDSNVRSAVFSVFSRELADVSSAGRACGRASEAALMLLQRCIARTRVQLSDTTEERVEETLAVLQSALDVIGVELARLVSAAAASDATAAGAPIASGTLATTGANAANAVDGSHGDGEEELWQFGNIASDDATPLSEGPRRQVNGLLARVLSDPSLMELACPSSSGSGGSGGGGNNGNAKEIAAREASPTPAPQLACTTIVALAGILTTAARANVLGATPAEDGPLSTFWVRLCSCMEASFCRRAETDGVSAAAALRVHQALAEAVVQIHGCCPHLPIAGLLNSLLTVLGVGPNGALIARSTAKDISPQRKRRRTADGGSSEAAALGNEAYHAEAEGSGSGSSSATTIEARNLMEDLLSHGEGVRSAPGTSIGLSPAVLARFFALHARDPSAATGRTVAGALSECGTQPSDELAVSSKESQSQSVLNAVQLYAALGVDVSEPTCFVGRQLFDSALRRVLASASTAAATGSDVKPGEAAAIAYDGVIVTRLVAAGPPFPAWFVEAAEPAVVELRALAGNIDVQNGWLLQLSPLAARRLILLAPPLRSLLSTTGHDVLMQSFPDFAEALPIVAMALFWIVCTDAPDGSKYIEKEERGRGCVEAMRLALRHSKALGAAGSEQSAVAAAFGASLQATPSTSAARSGAKRQENDANLALLQLEAREELLNCLATTITANDGPHGCDSAALRAQRQWLLFCLQTTPAAIKEAARASAVSAGAANSRQKLVNRLSRAIVASLGILSKRGGGMTPDAGEEAVCNRFYVAALKHRLGDGLRLDAVRSLASTLYLSAKPESALEGNDGGAWSPKDLCARLLAHSRFLEVLSGDPTELDRTAPSSNAIGGAQPAAEVAQLALLRLLLFLASAGCWKHEKPPETLVLALLEAYNASLSPRDVTIARLLYLMQLRGIEMRPEELRWGNGEAIAAAAAAENGLELPPPAADTATVASSGGGGDPWGYLLSQVGASVRRMRVSVECFPLERDLMPARLPCEAAPQNEQSAKSGQKGESDATLGADEGAGSDGDDSTTSESVNDDQKSPGARDEQESEDGEEAQELRIELSAAAPAPEQLAYAYDPSFLLPLMEGLSAVAPPPVERLATAGLLQYCVAALASRCAGIRAAAGAVLARALKPLLAAAEAAEEAANGAAAALSTANGGRLNSHLSALEAPPLLLFLRCLRDGLYPAGRRVPWAVAVSLARIADVISGNPAGEIYASANGLLLCRPAIKVDDLPLFHELYSGVARGGASGHSYGDGGGAEPLHSTVAARTKARMWMLKAIRVGIRTSQDMGLSASRRVAPLLMTRFALTTSLELAEKMLIVEVLERICDLRVAGTRYLISRVGFVAWAHLQLARSSTTSISSSESGANNTNSEALLGDSSLPPQLAAQLMRMLRTLLASGLALHTTPRHLVFEFADLGPVVAAAAVRTAPLSGGRRGRYHQRMHGWEFEAMRSCFGSAIHLLQDIQAACVDSAAAVSARAEGATSEMDVAEPQSNRQVSPFEDDLPENALELTVEQLAALVNAAERLRVGVACKQQLCRVVGSVPLLLARTLPSGGDPSAWVRDASRVALYCFRQENVGGTSGDGGGSGVIGSSDGSAVSERIPLKRAPVLLNRLFDAAEQLDLNGSGGASSRTCIALAASLAQEPVALRSLLASHSRGAEVERAHAAVRLLSFLDAKEAPGASNVATGKAETSGGRERLLQATLPQLRSAHTAGSSSPCKSENEVSNVFKAWLAEISLALLRRATAEREAGASAQEDAQNVEVAAQWCLELVESIPTRLQLNAGVKTFVERLRSSLKALPNEKIAKLGSGVGVPKPVVLADSKAGRTGVQGQNGEAKETMKRKESSSISGEKAGKQKVSGRKRDSDDAGAVAARSVASTRAKRRKN